MADRCDSVLVRAPGVEPGMVAAHSRYDEPLTERSLGRSRRWGDASEEVQTRVISDVVSQASSRDFTAHEIAFALAVIRTESGFNPDAASGSSSASGLGQLIDETAHSLGVTHRFSVSHHIDAFLTLLEEQLTWAKQRGGTLKEVFINAYARYHDGPSLQHGGAQIARREVIPWTEKIFTNCFSQTGRR